MADRVSSNVRRRIMASVGTKNTGPELTVRRLLHRLGYRFRLHRKDLPGKPDIVFPGRRKAVFVHGCFWHGHDCRWGKLPQSKLDYWGPKIAANMERDVRNRQDLTAIGWRSFAVWQCQLCDLDTLAQELVSFLDDT
ncbi:very short patch repair endonuclease [Oceanibaculum indicum]|uniref:Very short patch repair endonuclease n=1 Tax=Oceanibaculum indicum TaxID=526216 RepID=A0A420WA55_9PROT|nr:very short patch repair endonuclease [Oceanibaculum indicum]RKQ64148.1 DNA mismatch endonuclease (patch repair protein) [Oceanibaculum indicum]